ncbi:c-type cytochrome [Flavisolibacter ginsengisoli]|jgi:mono/diheme cytochrome c family protein|uniref:Cytochrome c, mono-and diheme variants n=1 Tax=Flavisolibacter ginsengisoli DSM 18119 TaxID=1121884 RepID=A0A1M4Y0Q4_9BACT|nr:cytochrome c [Flavisolibacter ginsengisoli]SHE99062.1 Cytochrome c, mono-and diheme variants [Flavisolibacter ginsengisoli DSM 18119]
MIRKILKWTLIVVLIIIAGVTLTTIFRQHLKYDAPYPNIKASTDTAIIARGKHLVVGPAHCIDCHSPLPNKDSLLNHGQEVLPVGGFAFDLPFGKFYTRNLTPDKETGIGNMTDGEIARVLRYGVKKNGEAVLPFMPFQDLSDEDLTAIISYLRSVKPVKNKVPDHNYNLVGNLIKAFMIKPVGPSTKPPIAVRADTTVAYGKHMVMAVANCNECHTKRDGIGNFVGAPLAGGTVFEEKGHPTLISPNLTPDPTGRITNWSQESFIKRFRLGKLIPYSHMPWEAFGRMTDTELIAIYKYLKTVKPAKTEIPKKDS